MFLSSYQPNKLYPDSRDILLVEEVLILLEADNTSDSDLLFLDRNPVVCVVECDLHVGVDDAGPAALMQQLLALLRPHVTELITQNKLYGWKWKTAIRCVNDNIKY